MNRIYFGDNLPYLNDLPNESVDLIYIDPPFNTGKTQKHTRIKTTKSEVGDRKGFQGNIYKTIELGTKAYQDSFNLQIEGFADTNRARAYQILAPQSSLYFLEEFLRPRLVEAYRILKPHGSLYFHIDYREVHYCKILLDNIFGRECFVNEIIWAYDFGGKAKSKWPAKHDNILFYVKDPNDFIFNTNEIDREDYMAPGLVSPEKAERKKLPTDTWFWPYVGSKSPKNTDTWWHTIVATNGRERSGYPTQKPRGIIERIIKASSLPGDTVLDFFAGSGTVGECCIALNRNFILMDNNQGALEVMAHRFAKIPDIDWVKFDPKPFQKTNNGLVSKELENNPIISITPEFLKFVTTANSIQKDLEEQSDLWKASPFEWILQLPAAKKGKLSKHIIKSWCERIGLPTSRPNGSNVSIFINDKPVAIKLSTLWTKGFYKFQQIREQGYEYIICLGISPFKAECWIFSREYALQHATTPQHKGAKEYWFTIDPGNPPDWAREYGGSLEKATLILINVFGKR